MKKISNIKKEISNKTTTKEVLLYLALGGGILTAMSISPLLFAPVFGYAHIKRHMTAKAAQNTFYHLKREGWIHVENSKGEISITITPEGKKHIAKSTVLNVEPIKQKKWDKKWRIISYDISTKYTVKRDALRSLIRRLGFVRMHKSMWIHPYDCKKELAALTSFFELNSYEVRLIVANDIGDDRAFKKHFKLRNKT